MLARVTGTLIPIFHSSLHHLNLQPPCQLNGKFKKSVMNLVDTSVVTLCRYNELLCASQCSFPSLHAPGQRHLILLVVIAITTLFKINPPSDHGIIKLVHGYPDDFIFLALRDGSVKSNRPGACIFMCS